MTITISIECDITASDDGTEGPEVGRILHRLAERFTSYRQAEIMNGAVLSDVHGNIFGRVTVTEEGEATVCRLTPGQPMEHDAEGSRPIKPEDLPIADILDK